MKRYIRDLFVTANEHISCDYSLLKLTSSEVLPPILPGQFAEIKANDCGVLLRRPISINNVDKEKNEVWFLIHAVGKGTRKLCSANVGDSLNVLFPLGNGFTFPPSKNSRILLIGGGVGTAPLLYFGNKLAEIGYHPVFLLGGRAENDILQTNLFELYGDVFLTTEDGSKGEKGYVTQHSILQTSKFDYIAACGPKPMMKAVARFAKRHNVPCEVSLENMMACGLGACLCCVENTIDGQLCVCKEGPIFNINKLLWQI